MGWEEQASGRVIWILPCPHSKVTDSFSTAFAKDVLAEGMTYKQCKDLYNNAPDEQKIAVLTASKYNAITKCNNDRGSFKCRLSYICEIQKCVKSVSTVEDCLIVSTDGPKIGFIKLEGEEVGDCSIVAWADAKGLIELFCECGEPT